jgi:integrase-like protein
MASIRKRRWKTAKGEPRIAWAVDFTDASGNRERRQFESRREADAFRVEIEGQLRAGTFRPDAAKVTVKEAADLFLAHCEARKKRREKMTTHNYNVYEGHVRNYISPDPERHAERKAPKRLRPFNQGIGAVKLGQLTARRVGEFCDNLKDAGVSVPTTRKILGTLKVMLEYAISQDLIAVNVARKIKVIGRRDEGSKKIVPPSKEAMREVSASRASCGRSRNSRRGASWLIPSANKKAPADEAEALLFNGTHGRPTPQSERSASSNGRNSRNRSRAIGTTMATRSASCATMRGPISRNRRGS